MNFEIYALVCMILSILAIVLVLTFLLGKYIIPKKYLSDDKIEKFDKKQFAFIGITIFLGLIILYFPIQRVIIYNQNIEQGANSSILFRSLGSAVYCAIRAFIAEGDFDVILEATNQFGGWLGSSYYALSWVYLIVAVLFTAGVALSLIKNILSSIRYHVNFSKEIYYISEANERSLSLARSVLAKNSNRGSSVLFFNVSKKTDEEEGFADSVKKLGCISFEKDICETSFKSNKNICRKFYFISENEDTNVKQALTLLKKLTSKQKLNTNKNEMYVFATSKASEVLLDAADNGNVKVRRVSENRNLAIKMMLEYPIFNRYIKDEETGEKKMHVLIVGFGQYGMELMKTLSWSCMMPLYSLKITVIDKLENIREVALKQFPELLTCTEVINGKEVKKYDIDFFGGVDIESAEFLNTVSKLKGVTTVYVTLGDDERNLTTAIELSSEFAKQSVLNGGFRPVIYPVVYSNIKYQTFKDCDRLCSFDGEDYLIELVGDMDTRFSLDTIEHKELESEAFDCHLFWSTTVASEEESRKTFEKYEYHRKSSLSRAVSLRLLKMFGADNNEKAGVMLDFLEHERWNAYMRAEGYVYAKGVKNQVAKVHKALVPYDKLDEVEKAKDSYSHKSKKEE